MRARWPKTPSAVNTRLTFSLISSVFDFSRNFLLIPFDQDRKRRAANRR
jgi:hypothetical protein